MEDKNFNLQATVIIKVDGEPEIEVNRFNSALFTFLGELSTRDHIFINTSEDTGTYIFSVANGFKALRNFMVEQDFTQHLNLTQVSDVDERAYQMHIEQQVSRTNLEIPDSLPEDFE